LACKQLALELVAGRDNALIFSQFTDFLKLLAERLGAAASPIKPWTAAPPQPSAC